MRDIIGKTAFFPGKTFQSTFRDLTTNIELRNGFFGSPDERSPKPGCCCFSAQILSEGREKDYIEGARSQNHTNEEEKLSPKRLKAG